MGFDELNQLIQRYGFEPKLNGTLLFVVIDIENESIEMIILYFPVKRFNSIILWIISCNCPVYGRDIPKYQWNFTVEKCSHIFESICQLKGLINWLHAISTILNMFGHFENDWSSNFNSAFSTLKTDSSLCMHRYLYVLQMCGLL